MKGVFFAAPLALLFACKGSSASDPPCDAVVRTWIDRMEDAEDDPRLAADAYDLLGPAARANLEERAERASRMQGERYTGRQMLADGRFALRFRPRQLTVHESGGEATVEIVGTDAQSEHASARCVREKGKWKLEPELPPAVDPSRPGASHAVPQ